MRSALALVGLLVGPLLSAGCFGYHLPGSCDINRPSPAAFGATWYDAGNASGLGEALLRAGWSRVANDTFVLDVNASVILAGTTREGAAAGQSFVALGVTDPRTNVTTNDAARAWLEPLLAGTMREAQASLGAPKLSGYNGGLPGCG